MRSPPTTLVLAGFLALAAGILSLPACTEGNNPGDDDDDGGLPTGGDGTITLAGSSAAYAVLSDETKLLLLLEKDPNGSNCGMFHHHVIEAQGFEMEFTIDDSDAAGSFLEAVVTVEDFWPDDDVNRQRYPVTSGESFNPADQNAIRNSMRDRLDMNQHPEITFRAQNLGGVVGSHNADLETTIRGVTDTGSIDWTATENGDRLEITATGLLDGMALDLPGGFGDGCYLDDVFIDLELVLQVVPQ